MSNECSQILLWRQAVVLVLGCSSLGCITFATAVLDQGAGGRREADGLQLSNKQLSLMFSPLSETREFAASHIPKTAGASFIHDMQKYFNESFPKYASGPEFGVDQTKSEHPDAVQLTVLRNPRDHVYSQYTECLLDTWMVKPFRCGASKYAQRQQRCESAE
jgi:hypothetical protein